MDDATYRPLPEDRADEYDRMLGYAFSPEEGPQRGPEPDSEGGDDDADADSDVGERRGVFDDDELLAVCRQIYLSSRVSEEPVSLVGLSAVASPPESRRKGAVAEMLDGSIDEDRDRDCSFAVLWPFERSFYRRNRPSASGLDPEGEGRTLQ